MSGNTKERRRKEFETKRCCKWQQDNKSKKEVKTGMCVEDSDVDGLRLKGSPEARSHLWTGCLQAHGASHRMGGSRADFKRVAGEG